LRGKQIRGLIQGFYELCGFYRKRLSIEY